MYADDTKVSREVDSAQQCTILQTDQNQIHTWSDTWQLKFNSTKCKIMHTGHMNTGAKYSMKEHGTEVVLKSSSEKQDLGEWIDDNLKFTSLAEHVMTKSNQILGLIKCSSYKDTNILKKLFTALVRPHLAYANTMFCVVSNVQERCGTN